jgi:dolichol-phosphate mannosyltransferase
MLADNVQSGSMTVVDGRPDISVIVPVFNERASLSELVERILEVASTSLSAHRVEVLLVDDGSRDGSWVELHRLAKAHATLRCFRLRRNFGKATALSLGAEMACGGIVVTLDADLQDDPIEIPRFLAKLDEGYDLVSGWKENRQDPSSKTMPSRFFNAVMRAISGVKLRDFNCGFKAARQQVYAEIPLYGELHRYIPLLADALGYRVGEIPVLHHSRRHGQSKYGFERYARGFLDLLTVLTITRFGQRPGHLFGGLGIVVGLLGFVALAHLTLVWFAGGEIGTRPLLLFGIMLELLSAQLLTLGMLAELILHRTRPRSALTLLAEATPPPAGWLKDGSAPGWPTGGSGH